MAFELKFFFNNRYNLRRLEMISKSCYNYNIPNHFLRKISKSKLYESKDDPNAVEFDDLTNILRINIKKNYI